MRVQAHEAAKVQLPQLITNFEQASSASFSQMASLEEKKLEIASLSQRLQKMDEVVSSLRTTYKKLEREKMVVIMALQFLASRELPLHSKILQKNFELSNL